MPFKPTWLRLYQLTNSLRVSLQTLALFIIITYLMEFWGKHTLIICFSLLSVFLWRHRIDDNENFVIFFWLRRPLGSCAIPSFLSLNLNVPKPFGFYYCISTVFFRVLLYYLSSFCVFILSLNLFCDHLYMVMLRFGFDLSLCDFQNPHFSIVDRLEPTMFSCLPLNGFHFQARLFFWFSVWQRDYYFVFAFATAYVVLWYLGIINTRAKHPFHVFFRQRLKTFEIRLVDLIFFYKNQTGHLWFDLMFISLCSV